MCLHLKEEGIVKAAMECGFKPNDVPNRHRFIFRLIRKS